ncbi:HAMP domain-containing sensor histidine kinase [Streptomyces sp. NBC_01304]|uniref:HAMP domain-containing sensor histidine kinase n=1 Tax=Streptomyces sp. NBC_01304 TaxID=2903818 RepID=UPI002E10F9AB|nr:HAMP domain-containing histidine kinase [Streptomyces sp. NBC_01304]
MIKRFRALPLRSRLALLVATAVAVAVAASAVACWFVVRNALYDSLDDSLAQDRASLNSQLVADLAQRGQCRASGPILAPDSEDPAAKALRLTIQVVDPQGHRCVIRGEALKVDTSDTRVAANESEDSLHNAKAADGTEYRVLTYHLENYTSGAVSLGRPLTEVNDTLSNLTWFLVFVAGIGAVGAGIAGLWVARTGLRPVDDLTETVEHVARTEDLTVQIPAEGDDEIARLSRSFNAMTAALASSQERQAQLIADAGHELRTPLTSLRTNIELLARSEDTGRAIPPDDRKALLASVKAQMTELAALIGDLQELARPDTGHAAKVQVVGLHEIVQAAIERARLRGPELTITAELDPWFVRAEPPALERAIVNILDNAVKFSPPGASIEVSLAKGELTVRDHGPGIPADELPHVFDRFWRSPSARALPGSGLGLSIVARTVQQSGGSVELRAGEGCGTVASVSLPGAPTPPPSAG